MGLVNCRFSWVCSGMWQCPLWSSEEEIESIRKKSRKMLENCCTEKSKSGILPKYYRPFCHLVCVSTLLRNITCLIQWDIVVVKLCLVCWGRPIPGLHTSGANCFSSVPIVCVRANIPTTVLYEIGRATLEQRKRWLRGVYNAVTWFENVTS